MDITAKIMKKAVKILEFYTDKVYTAKKVHKCCTTWYKVRHIIVEWVEEKKEGEDE